MTYHLCHQAFHPRQRFHLWVEINQVHRVLQLLNRKVQEQIVRVILQIQKRRERRRCSFNSNSLSHNFVQVIYLQQNHHAVVHVPEKSIVGHQVTAAHVLIRIAERTEVDQNLVHMSVEDLGQVLMAGMAVGQDLDHIQDIEVQGHVLDLAHIAVVVVHMIGIHEVDLTQKKVDIVDTVEVHQMTGAGDMTIT